VVPRGFCFESPSCRIAAERRLSRLETHGGRSYRKSRGLFALQAGGDYALGMVALSVTAVVPLFTDSSGAIRVRGTRVTLDSIITAFRLGATAEEIAQQFPTIGLADAYIVIAYYLQNAAEVDAYLVQRQAEAALLKEEVESRFDPAGVRARLVARRNTDRAG